MDLNHYAKSPHMNHCMLCLDLKTRCNIQHNIKTVNEKDLPLLSKASSSLKAGCHFMYTVK